MIKSIELKNIQSHKENKLEFHSGINAIVGSSNNGKTALLRALNWARYNRPLGIDTLCSHWALDDKGNQKEEMKVTIENENGIVTRRRFKTENQYIVNDKELNVVKSDIPIEVEQTLKLSETNIQNQQDSPFLLSASSGEVAKYFNRVVRLDVIDKVLSNAETERRRTNSEINNTEKTLKEKEKELENYKWLDSINDLISKYEVIEKQKNEYETNVQSLNQLINDYEKYDNIIKLSKKVIENKNKIIEIDNITNNLNVQKNKITQLENDIEKYNDVSKLSELDLSSQNKYVQKLEKLLILQNQLERELSVLSKNIELVENNKVYDFEVSKKYIVKINKVSSLKNELYDDYERLLNDTERYNSNIKYITDNKKEVIELKKQLPKLCPICNRPLEDC